ncbi:MAG: hypothetical protein MUE51_15970 [Thermoleophilia bacterium]|jgi:hypothetical protein|nr:hypothetical protein [Thermoleophilia bacterium]
MDDESQGPRPDVYARLAHDAEVRLPERTPARGVRWIGLVLVALTVAAVIVTVLRAGLP